MIERIFGILKSSYTAGTKRFHSRRWHAALVYNVVAALHSRRLKIVKKISETLYKTISHSCSMMRPLAAYISQINVVQYNGETNYITLTALSIITF